MSPSTTKRSAGGFLLRPNSSAAGLALNGGPPPSTPVVGSVSSQNSYWEIRNTYIRHLGCFSSRNELPLIKSQRRLCREVNLIRPVLACTGQAAAGFNR